MLAVAGACAPLRNQYSSSPSLKIYGLRCEGLDEPLGIDSEIPHFSWKISCDTPSTPQRAMLGSPQQPRCNKPIAQQAYQIEVATSEAKFLAGEADLWQSGKVISPDQVMVSYRGIPLSSKQQCWWRVRIWDDDKESEWSEPQRFGVGILGGMKGTYIAAAPGHSALLRKKFHVSDSFSQALLYINSLGYCEVYLNGHKVERHNNASSPRHDSSVSVLSPAVSQLNKHSLINVYDVSNLLKKGENDLVLWTGAGWYRKHFESVYDGAVVCAELDIDGTTALTTDEGWVGRESGYRDLGTWIHDDYTGESINAALIPKVLTGTALDTLEWVSVDTVSVSVPAVQQMCEPCVIQETFSAVSVKPYGTPQTLASPNLQTSESPNHPAPQSPTMWIADMGRVVNGLPEIVLPQLPAGHETTVGFSDTKFDDGTVFTFLHNTLISSGAEGGDTFSDKFIQQAYQYLVFVGLPVAPRAEDIKVHRMRTDYPRRATFSCSDTDLCAIHDMVAYTLENLAFNGYMVDCAHLEKHGYGGDGNASTLTLQTLFDVAPLYYNWLQAWNDVLRPDGSLPNTAPYTHPAGGGPYWCSFIIQAPWRTFMSYSDDRSLRKGYPAMKQWLEYAETSMDGGLYFRSTEGKDWGLGDWLAPQGVDVKDKASVDLVSNCALSQSLSDMARIAGHLGLKHDSIRYAQQLASLNRHIHQAFYHPDGTYGTGSQIDIAYPLLVGAVPDSLVALVESQLLERTKRLYNNHIACGLVGVPVLTEWATLARQPDFLYTLLKQPDYPGYLHMRNSGATAVWESWNGERSRLHNCYNGIGSWFYQALGGILPTQPGYRHVAIYPQTPQGVSWVEVTEETPYGTLRVRWDRIGEPDTSRAVPYGSDVCPPNSQLETRNPKNGSHPNYQLTVTIPIGITADIFGQTYHNGTYTILF